MTDLVSVVIPVYNTNDRFKACFESVLKQKYQNIEVILVDDGSCDTSAQICDMVALSTSIFSVYVIHKSNGGVSRARNLGIDFANGKYLVFIDSDDRVTPDYVSDFMEAREIFPDVGHIWCGFEHNSSQHSRYVFSEYEVFSILNRDNYMDLYKKVLSQGPCMKLFDRNVLICKQIKMNESISLAEDIIFNLDYLDVCQFSKICVINKPNYVYMDKNDYSLKNQYRKNLITYYNNYLDVLLCYLKKWNLTDSKTMSAYYDAVYYEYLVAMDNTFNRNNNMSFFEKIRNNSDILRLKNFADALSMMKIKIPDIMIKAYKTKNYFWVWLYKKLMNCLKCIFNMQLMN